MKTRREPATHQLPKFSSDLILSSVNTRFKLSGGNRWKIALCKTHKRVAVDEPGPLRFLDPLLGHGPPIGGVFPLLDFAVKRVELVVRLGKIRRGG